MIIEKHPLMVPACLHVALRSIRSSERGVCALRCSLLYVCSLRDHSLALCRFRKLWRGLLGTQCPLLPISP